MFTKTIGSLIRFILVVSNIFNVILTRLATIMFSLSFYWILTESPCFSYSDFVRLNSIGVIIFSLVAQHKFIELLESKELSRQFIIHVIAFTGIATFVTFVLKLSIANYLLGFLFVFSSELLNHLIITVNNKFKTLVVFGLRAVTLTLMYFMNEIINLEIVLLFFVLFNITSSFFLFSCCLNKTLNNNRLLEFPSLILFISGLSLQFERYILSNDHAIVKASDLYFLDMATFFCGSLAGIVFTYFKRDNPIVFRKFFEWLYFWNIFLIILILFAVVFFCYYNPTYYYLYSMAILIIFTLKIYFFDVNFELWSLNNYQRFFLLLGHFLVLGYFFCSERDHLWFWGFWKLVIMVMYTSIVARKHFTIDKFRGYLSIFNVK